MYTFIFHPLKMSTVWKIQTKTVIQLGKDILHRVQVRGGGCVGWSGIQCGVEGSGYAALLVLHDQCQETPDIRGNGLVQPGISI